MFLSKSYVVLGLTVRALIIFKLTFVTELSQGWTQPHSLACKMLVFPTLFVEKLLVLTPSPTPFDCMYMYPKQPDPVQENWVQYAVRPRTDLQGLHRVPFPGMMYFLREAWSEVVAKSHDLSEKFGIYKVVKTKTFFEAGL